MQSVARTAATKKNSRRFNKQIAKVCHRLQKNGLLLSETPSLCVVLANCGLGNDVTAEQVTGLLSSCGVAQPADLNCPPARSYCLLLFESTEDADAARNALHLRQLATPEVSARPHVVVYALFASRAPEVGLLETPRQQLEQQLPPGLQLVPDYVTEEEEAQLLGCVEWRSEDATCSELRHRRVRHYGYEFQYGSNTVDHSAPLVGAPLPAQCRSLLERLAVEHGVGDNTKLPDQLTVNEYRPGQGIPLHVDTHSQFEEPLLVLSLGAQPVAMKLREERTQQQLELDLPPRSLLVLRGEARLLWLHGIARRKSDVVPTATGWTLRWRVVVRTSFTFRWLRPADAPPCACAYPERCDSQQQPLRQAHLVEDPAAVERRFVHSVYERIAPHFSETRQAHWPAVAAFLDALPAGALVADLGCGNGKYLSRRGAKHDCLVVGLELSAALCAECVARPGDAAPHVVRGDVLAPALRAGLWDAAISVAVLHHLASPARRVTALQRMAQLLRPYALGLVTVWAMEQRGDANGNQTSHYANRRAPPVAGDTEDEVDPRERLLTDFVPVHISRTSFPAPDMLVPWTLRLKSDKDKSSSSSSSSSSGASGSLLHRYYHLFVEGELDRLVLETGCLRVVRSFYDDGNWCVIFCKKDDDPVL